MREDPRLHDAPRGVVQVRDRPEAAEPRLLHLVPVNVPHGVGVPPLEPDPLAPPGLCGRRNHQVVLPHDLVCEPVAYNVSLAQPLGRVQHPRLVRLVRPHHQVRVALRGRGRPPPGPTLHVVPAGAAKLRPQLLDAPPGHLELGCSVCR